MLLDKNKYEVKGLRGSVVNLRDFSDILSLNKLQIHNAANAIFFSDYKHSKYVYELWKQEHKKLVDHKAKVNEAPGFDENQESIGHILHIYEVQLPFIPKLSFLNVMKLLKKNIVILEDYLSYFIKNASTSANSLVRLNGGRLCQMRLP